MLALLTILRKMDEAFQRIKTTADSFENLWNDMTAIANERNNFEDILLVEDEIEALKSFLVLKALKKDTNDEMLSPSVTVAELWQILVSFTREYAQLCHAILPSDVEVRVIHCKPYLLYGPKKLEYEARYASAYNMYKDLLGKNPPRSEWPKPTSEVVAEGESRNQATQDRVVEDLTI